MHGMESGSVRDRCAGYGLAAAALLDYLLGK